MTAYKIAVLPGDGIGPEVIEEGIKVLRGVQRIRGIQLDCSEFEWGSTYYMEHGCMMPTDALERLMPICQATWSYSTSGAVQSVGSPIGQADSCRQLMRGPFFDRWEILSST